MVFLLIVFFMLSTHFVHTELLQLHVSELDKTQAAAGNEPQIYIRLRDHARVEINNKPYTVSEFPRVIATLLAGHQERKILLTAERPVTVQALVTAMDLILAAGGTNLELVQ